MSKFPGTICCLVAVTLACSTIQADTILIDADFPGGTWTNPTFTEIDNDVGNNSWTQSTGVLATSMGGNSTVGAVSASTVDFTTLGANSLLL